MKRFLLLLVFFLFPVSVFARSSSTIVVDGDSGRILYENNLYDSMLISSITIIMTCILTIENADLDSEVEIGDEVLEMYGTNIYVQVGEKLTIRDLLYGLMLRSGNDASVVLAKNVFGSEEKFVDMMNKKASELGMNYTKFENPHGLDESTKNYSTAYDMSLLAKYAYNNKTYRKIVSTKKYVTKSNLKSYVWYNRMSLINDYKYCVGGKNGYTPKAGKTLVSYASKNNMNLIIVSLNDSDIYNNHEKLYNIYFNRYKKYKIIDREDFKIDSSLIGMDVYLKDSFSYVLEENELDNISTLIKIDNKKSNVVGKVIISLDGKRIGSLNIYTKNKKEDKNNIFKKLKSLFVGKSK